MTVTWIPKSRGWDGPNDEWLPSDDALQNYLDSFTARDIPKLRLEARQPRIEHTPPAESMMQAVVEAFEAPTVRSMRSMRALTDRQLVDVLSLMRERQAAREAS